MQQTQPLRLNASAASGAISRFGRSTSALGLSTPGSQLRWLNLALFVLLQLPAYAVVLTQDTVLTPLDSSYEGQDVVASNCVLTVDGPHTFASLKLLGTATLNHSLATNGLLSLTASVSNELQVLTGTNPVPLLFSNVVVTSVGVSDTNNTLTYTQNVDYVLGSSNQFTTLQRTDTSAIPDGASVLVNYIYILGTTNAGLNLTLTGDLEVAPGARIAVDGLGRTGNFVGCGGSAGSPLSGGGGTHGGYGGLGVGQARCGFAYDSLLQPAFPGGSGGSGSGGAGGAGGGMVLLHVGGTALINGALSANGMDATNSRAGGGSGGSIWLTAQTLSGTGSISADGGAGESIYGGGGGGGGIALYVATNQFAGSIYAWGGSGFIGGGAGTIYQQETDLTLRQVTLDNGGRAGTNSSVQVTNGADVLVTGRALLSPSGAQTIGNLVIAPGSALIPSASLQSLTVTATNVTIQAGGGILLDNAGYGSGSGLGAGASWLSNNVPFGNGAGHGGVGGWSGYTPPGSGGGWTSTACNSGSSTWYDYEVVPSTPGSGGGSCSGQGGNGGGALRLVVLNMLQLEGAISANGTAGSAAGSGGGSGGSLWLTVGTLTGAGSISANGGDGFLPNAGGGSGGRVSVGYANNLFTGSISAYGGNGVNWGGAGSVYYKPAGQPGTMLFDNAGHTGSAPTLTFPLSGDALVVQGAAQVQTAGNLTASGLVVRSNAVLSFDNTSSANLVRVTGDAVVERGGLLSVIGTAPVGAGPGGTYGLAGGGAGHAGYGAAGADPRAGGGLSYGTVSFLNEMGSGGGGSSNGVSVGGKGGGALNLTIAGALRLEGTISADATAATASGGGGGSGGSVYLTVGQLAGAGTVSANGGDGGAAGGGGGGGRLAIIYTAPQTNLFTGLLNAFGGNGVNRGGAGTIYISTYQQPAQVFIDNGGLAGTNTPCAGGNFSLTVEGAARAVCSGTVLNLLVRSNASLTASSPSSGFSFGVSGDATIESGATLRADGMGAGAGIGAGRYCVSGGSSYGGGGGYGGSGGIGAVPCAAGGQLPNGAYPATGFGCYDSSLGTGSRGGGTINLTVTGTLLLNGAVSANGTTDLLPGAGGGSGGGISLRVGTLAGNGQVTANGGNGAPGRGGGGGGGRIAILYGTNIFSGVLSARGGVGYQNGGAGTVYTKANALASGLLVLDNGGMVGTNSLLMDSGSIDLVISGGATVCPTGSPASYSSLTVASNSILSLGNYSQMASVIVTGNATIDPGGAITSDGLGYIGGQGLGAGSSSGASKGGGGHGGVGGGNPINGGGANDSLQFPSLLGSGGGNGSGNQSAPFGGTGGGALHLMVNQTLTVNGRISADGLAGDTSSGGGAGGSVFLTVGALAGNGTISANGGAGNGTAGGGGGGRVFVLYTQDSFTGTMSAFGGSGNGGRGGAGTVYNRATTSAIGRLLVDNGGFPGTNTPLGLIYGASMQPFDLTVQGGAIVQALDSPRSLSNLVVSSGSTFTVSSAPTNLMLLVQGDLTLSSNSAIVLDGKGFGVGVGPGAGGTNSSQGSGAGYGGAGGTSASGVPGGITYGSATQPVDRGSGGGAGAGKYAGGSQGGGALYLVVNGMLDLEGLISANGNPGLQLDSGGGSGGSLCITAGALTGKGLLQANGGAGAGANGGGGGGGRIALYSPANTFAGLTTASGGAGASPGSDGTVFTSSSLLLPLIQGTVHDTNGQPVAGVQVQASGGQPTATTDANGIYSLGVAYGWTGSLTPGLPNLSFVPGMRSLTNVLANVTGQDFLMVPTLVPTLSTSVDGTNLWARWGAIPGVSYQAYWSSNLVDWLPWGDLIPGSNGVLQTSLPLTNAPQGFFRLKATN